MTFSKVLSKDNFSLENGYLEITVSPIFEIKRPSRYPFSRFPYSRLISPHVFGGSNGTKNSNKGKGMGVL